MWLEVDLTWNSSEIKYAPYIPAPPDYGFAWIYNPDPPDYPAGFLNVQQTLTYGNIANIPNYSVSFSGGTTEEPYGYSNLIYTTTPIYWQTATLGLTTEDRPSTAVSLTISGGLQVALPILSNRTDTFPTSHITGFIGDANGNTTPAGYDYGSYTTTISYYDHYWVQLPDDPSKLAGQLVDAVQAARGAFIAGLGKAVDAADASELLEANDVLGNTCAAIGVGVNVAVAGAQLSAALQTASSPIERYQAVEQFDVSVTNAVIKAGFVALAAATPAIIDGFIAGALGTTAIVGGAAIAPAVALAVVGIGVGLAASFVYDLYIESKVTHLEQQNFESAFPPPVILVHDGYIAGATVFADSNGNGKLDPGELFSTTDSGGGFSTDALAGGSGPLVAFGGVDISTGLPFTGHLSAPAGSSVLNPVTTVLAALQEMGVSDFQQAQQTVLAAFGLSPAVGLTTLDPIAATRLDDAFAPAVYSVGGKVLDTVQMISAALAGLGATSAAAYADTFVAIANAINNLGPGQTLDLSNKATVTALITSIAQSEHLDVSQIVDGLATIIVASNIALDQALQTDVSGNTLIIDVSSAERVAQGVTSSELQNDGGNATLIANSVSKFTGDNLTNAIADAKMQLSSGPNVVSVSVSADNGSAHVDPGHLVTITVTASASVNVTGVPTLQLNDNGVAYYSGGSGSNALEFTYVVMPADNQADLQVTGFDLPFGASIVDANGNNLTGPVTGDLGLTIAGKLAPATVAQEIHGLYLTLYGIAATQPGIIYWENYLHDKFDPSITVDNAATTAVSLNDQTYLGEQMTAGSPIVNGTTYFATLYPTSMSDMDYVKALYQNMSNFIGTQAGDNYWLAVLQQAEATNGGDVIGARESIAGQFVHDFLSNDLTIGAAALNVTPSDYTLLVNGQQALLNRALISQDYADETVAPGGSIINFTTVTSPAFAAAHNVVAAVTSDPATVAVAITGINNAIAQQDLSLI